MSTRQLASTSSKVAIPAVVLLFCMGMLAAPAVHARLIGGPKTVALDASGQVPGNANVVSAQMSTGRYVKGATRIVVPVVAIAFESRAMGSATSSFIGRNQSLEARLSGVDDDVLQSIADQAQAIVEADLRAQGFELLPVDAVDQEPRYAGIAKNGVAHVETKDDFASGFGGNGVFNRWFTAGNRPFFGTGMRGVFSDHSSLVHLARDTGKTVVLYRFKVQFTDIDAKGGFAFSHLKGKTSLHMVVADMGVFTPANTMGAMFKLDANLSSGVDFVSDMGSQGRGDNDIVADPAAYQDGSLKLIKAVSQQFAAAIKKGQ